MRLQLILVLGLVAFATASPLLDKKNPSSMKVIDIPADLFAEASENTEDVKKPVEEVPAETVSAVPVSDNLEEKVEAPAQVDIAAKEDDKKVAGDAVATSSSIDEDDKKKDDSVEVLNGDRPSIFGFRLPTIVIMRRPAVFDDPFSFFPFSSFNRRPSFSEPAPRPIDTRDGIRPQPSAAAVPSEARPVGGISDLMGNMRQQMDSIFSSLFAPNPAFYPNRQFFPRPFFPSVPIDSSEDEGIDFSKLPDNYKNSTSETKVVDGRVVEVNRTVQKIGGNNSNGFFQISIFKVRPSESPTAEEPKPDVIPPAAIEGSANEKGPDSDTKEVTTVKAEQEAEMNNPSLNEVDQDKKDTVMTKTKYETDPGLLEEPSAPVPAPLPLTQEIIYDFVPLAKSMPLVEGTKNKGKGKPLDLSSDLRVNNLMANDANGRLRSLVDPDEVEVIEV